MEYPEYCAYREHVAARLTRPIPPARTPAESLARRGISLDAAPRRVAPVRASAALTADYRKRLLRLVDAMSRSVLHWLVASYRANLPEMAADASPARTLTARTAALRRRWERNFARLADDLARHFAETAARRSDLALKNSLRRSGFAVEFKMTRAMNDVLQATVAENVSLIKSIPEKYFTQIEGDVMRSVQAGRDLHSLTEALTKQHGVARRRAELISRDQNNKASAALARVRYGELGIRKARWLHSGGGKEPRPTHVRASEQGTVFDLDEGWYDPAVKKHVLPGELISCRCVAVPILEDAA